MKELLAKAGRLLLVFSIFAIVGIVVVGAKAIIGEYLKENREEKFEITLIKLANKFNQRLPLSIDKDTRLDSAVAKGKSIEYKYTLINSQASSISGSAIINHVKPIMINSVCSNKDLYPVLRRGAEFIYTYYGKNGGQVISFSIYSADCKNS